MNVCISVSVCVVCVRTNAYIQHNSNRFVCLCVCACVYVCA